jgi:hypothetical protein
MAGCGAVHSFYWRRVRGLSEEVGCVLDGGHGSQHLGPDGEMWGESPIEVSEEPRGSFEAEGD